MRRNGWTGLLALIAVAVFLSSPATADEGSDLREQVKQLREKADALEARRIERMQRDIESYLANSGAWRGAQGNDALAGVSISASFTAVSQNTMGLDQVDRSVVNGDVDLDFDFQVTDNLDLFIYLTANGRQGNDTFPGLFGPDSHGVPPESFPAIAGTTFGSVADGIGVNGTTPTDPGSITVREAGIHSSLGVGDNKLHWEMGAIDPRLRFLQNAFADDENTQFINNLFDDSPAVYWLSDSTGRTVFGVHMWISFGGDKQFTVNWGWFNTPGQFFNNGQFYAQFHWQGEVGGREMNLRIMGFVQEYFVDSVGDGDTGGGASWDWWFNDKIGLFFRVAANGDDVNPVEIDFSAGITIVGVMGSRPNDVLGFAAGVIQANEKVFPGGLLPEDIETTLELYYKYVTEDGKLQITPHVMIVDDPGGNTAPWSDDILFILGVRVHVPF